MEDETSKDYTKMGVFQRFHNIDWKADPKYVRRVSEYLIRPLPAKKILL